MNIIYNKDNTHVEDSYLIKNRKSIRNEVDWIKTIRKARKLPVTRTDNSYVREWIGHNRLYELGIKKDHTRSVDLNENNGILEELLWMILSI